MIMFVCIFLRHILAVQFIDFKSLFTFTDTWGDLCLFLIKQKIFFSMNECLS